MKIKSKIKNLTKLQRYGLASVAIFSLAFGQALLPLAAQASDPQFNIFTPYTHTQQAGHDYYLLDVKNETKGTEWGSAGSPDNGDVLVFYLYYHNGVNGTTADNTRLRATLPTGQGTQSVTGYLWADNALNATPSNPLSQSVTVNMSSSQSMEYVSGSAKWFPNQADWRSASPTPFPNGQTESQLFGSGINIGSIQGCWEYSGAIVFKARVKGQDVPPPPADNYELAIRKTVRNLTDGQSGYADSVNADQGDRVRFRVELQNTGNATLHNVRIADVLPSGLSYVSGSFTFETYGGSTAGLSYSDCFGNGLALGSLAPGEYIRVTFDANVNSGYGSSNYILTNTAYASSTETGVCSDTAQVCVYGNYNPGVGCLTIEKTVRNLTDNTGWNDSVNADPNDRVQFQIIVRNTGNSAVHNVRLADTLPSGLTYISGTFQIDSYGTYYNSDYFGSGLNIGTIAGGGAVKVLFEAGVSSNYYNNYSQTLTNTAYARSDETGQISDWANVYVYGQSQPSGALLISKFVRNISTGQSGNYSSTNANPGETVQFTVQVAASNTTLYNVRVSDNLPSGLSYVSGSLRVDNSSGYSDSMTSGGLNLGSLASGQTRTITFQATVNSNAGQTLTNTAYAYADNCPQQQATASVLVNAVTITTNLQKTVSNVTNPNGSSTENSGVPGDTLQYTISYTNSTGSSISNAQILDVLPSYTTLTNVNNGGAYDSSTNMITWSVGTISPNATVTVSYQVRVQSVPSTPYVIANTAAIKGSNLQLINSNEVRTTVTGQVLGVKVSAVTGGNSLGANIAKSLLVTAIALAAIFFIVENSERMRQWRLRWKIAMIRIKA